MMTSWLIAALGCEQLASLTLPSVRITSAQTVAAGTFADTGDSSAAENFVCRVR